jgi:hypothetical protein
VSVIDALPAEAGPVVPEKTSEILGPEFDAETVIEEEQAAYARRAFSPRER